MKPATLARRFTFLDELRESGATNMYGAAPYLITAFNIGRDEAVKITSLWMKTFDRETPAIDRARKALAE